MAMNAMDWISNIFGLDVPEFERQLSNWCNLNSARKLQIVFDCDDLKKFLHNKKLHKTYNGKCYQFSTPNLTIVWDEAGENWGLVQKVLSRNDNEECMYTSPRPSNAGGVAFIKKNA